jgi:hypothetical protein
LSRSFRTASAAPLWKCRSARQVVTIDVELGDVESKSGPVGCGGLARAPGPSCRRAASFSTYVEVGHRGR